MGHTNTYRVIIVIAFIAVVCVPVSSFAPSASASAFHGSRSGTNSLSRLYQQQGSTKSPEPRQPWNVLRFVQQSSKFVNSPFAGTRSSTSVRPGDILWQPSSTISKKNNLNLQFSPLDDVVMGGASSSTFDNASGMWKGLVTDANSGGFSGIRTTANSAVVDLSSCRGLQFTIQTSEKSPQRLKVVVRDSPEFNGIAWTASIDLPKWSKQRNQVTVRVPLDSKTFVPTIFAKIVSEKKGSPVDKSQLSAIQLVYSKFEYEGALNPKFKVGDFDLQLLEVRTY